MKIRIILTLLTLAVCGILLFIFNQVIVPEAGTDLAVAQVTEGSTGAGVRAVGGLTNVINTWVPIVTVLGIFGIWFNYLKDTFFNVVLKEF